MLKFRYRWKTIAKGSEVIVVKPYLPIGLNEEETNTAMKNLVDQFFAEEIDEYILWYYTPMALSFSRHLKPALTVYDCMDQLALFKGAPARLQELERELLNHANLIFTGGQTLYEDKRKGQQSNIPIGKVGWQLLVCFHSQVMDIGQFWQAFRVNLYRANR